MRWDVLVLGAGAAGLMTAAIVGQRGARVAVLDHAPEIGRKILISGGGRCNFTHLDADASRYLSQNPRFARSALARYRPHDFLKLVEKHRIAWHEKEVGQIFCDHSARDIVAMLKAECALGQVRFYLGHNIENVLHHGDCFSVKTGQGVFHGRTVVLATGGLAVPKLGATDFALRIAKQFHVPVVSPMPALVPLVLPETSAGLAGISLPVTTSLMGKPSTGKAGCKAPSFTDGMVFTHRGVSGPAVLQISSYRDSGQAVRIDLLPGQDALAVMMALREARPKAHGPALLEALPARLARYFAASFLDDRPLAAQPVKVIRALAEKMNGWVVMPSGTEGYAKAEVMRGGIDTRALSSQTMEVQTVPGLYVVGEAVDVTGWLGGYNFQWAWASGVAAGRAVAGHVVGV